RGAKSPWLGRPTQRAVGSRSERRGEASGVRGALDERRVVLLRRILGSVVQHGSERHRRRIPSCEDPGDRARSGGGGSAVTAAGGRLQTALRGYGLFRDV